MHPINLKQTFLNARNAIRKRKNILKCKAALSYVLMLCTVLVSFAFTGAVYYRNVVVITDGGAENKIFTTLDDPDEILAEEGYTLGELDVYDFSGFTDDKATIDILRSVTVTVKADGETYSVEMSQKETVADALDKLGIALGEYDAISEGKDKAVTGGEEIVVTRAFNVTINADGEALTVEALDNTVADVLSRAGIDLGERDLVDAEEEAAVTPDMEITVKRVTVTERREEQTVAFETEYVESTLLQIGETETIQEGVNGTEEVTFSEKYVDGILESSEEIARKSVSEPVTEIISVGTALSTPYSKREFEEIKLENGLPTDYDSIISGKAVAYTARQGCGTASGRKLEIGTVGVNPEIIPYGALLYIVSQDGKYVYGAAVAADTGDLTEVLVDCFMGTTEEHYSDACAFGAKMVDIYIINTGIH